MQERYFDVVWFPICMLCPNDAAGEISSRISSVHLSDLPHCQFLFCEIEDSRPLDFGLPVCFLWRNT